jgi:hypothetical protein
MRTSSSLLFSIVAAVVPLTAAACTATSEDSSTAETDTAASSTTPAPSVADDTPGVAPETSPAPSAPASSGVLLVADPNVVLLAVTGDDRAVYLSNGTLAAIPLAGGAADVIQQNVDASSLSVIASGPEVLVWSGGADGVAPLSGWSKATGLVPLSTASTTGLAAVSADGAWVAFGDGATPAGGGSGAQWLVIAKADGSGRKSLAGSETTQTCTPSLAFAQGNTLFAETCNALRYRSGPTLSVVAASVQTFSGPSWGATTLATGVEDGAWAFDPSGAYVWAPVSAAPENGYLMSVSSDPTTTLVDTGVAAGYFGGTGGLFYRSLTGELKHFDTSAPAKSLELLSTGVRRVYDVAPDGDHVAYATSFTGIGSAFDLLVASASGGAPAAIVSGNLVTSCTFATGAGYVVYVESLVGKESVYAQPIGGGAPLLLGAAPHQVSPAQGATFALGLNAVKDPSLGLLSDLAIADASGKNPVKTLAQRARAGFLLSADLAQVVYVAPGGAAPGLYAAPAS